MSEVRKAFEKLSIKTAPRTLERELAILKDTLNWLELDPAWMEREQMFHQKAKAASKRKGKPSHERTF